jgi:hypothetical protein
MNHLRRVICCALVFSGVAFGQSSPTGENDPTQGTGAQRASTQPDQRLKLAPGSVVPAELVKTVDAKKAGMGDEVQAKVNQDLKADDGQVVVPKDTKLIGHITEAQARSKESQQSRVAIVFDHAMLKDGSNVPLPMSIQAIVSQAALRGNANATPDNASQPASQPGGGMPSGGTNPRAMGTGGGVSAPTSNTPDMSSGGAQTGTAPAVTAATQGVVGISDLKLSSTANSNNGSVISSEKSNVKLESGTLLLLRVSQ